MRLPTNSSLLELPNYGSFFAHLGRGFQAQPDPAPIRHESVFQQLLLDMAGNWSPIGFSQIKRVLYQAMVHFRRMKNGDLTGGFAELQHLRLTVDTLPTEAKQYTEAMLLPMLAYYYFRTGDYTVARAYNQQAVLLSSKLQTNYPILHLHQIRQHINL